MFLSLGMSLLGLLLVVLASLVLYACSDNQQLFPRVTARRLMLVLAAGLLTFGTTVLVSRWGGLVGGVLALLGCMTISAVLPFLALLRRRR